MGHKKGKQAGEFSNKRANSLHRYLLNDYISEADEFRNPVRSTFRAEDLGRWHKDGTGVGGRDKWSTLFSKSSSSSYSSSSQTNNARLSSINNSAAVGRRLAHLRFLLEERRLEDRIDDRQLRLRLQRQRMQNVHNADRDYCCANDVPDKERNEIGWLLRQHDDNINIHKPGKDNSIPTLQTLAAQRLGPLLPMYVAACGHEYVGNALQSVSSDILCETSIALASSTEATITDGVLKALIHSGVASRLVLKGTETPFDDDECTKIDDCDRDDADEDDIHLLSDVGLLSIIPRIQPISDKGQLDDNDNENEDSSYDNWETVVHDITTVGCIHLTRLELIDIPLHSGTSSSSSGGISVDALRHVLKSCPGITHLSLSGCFSNWHQNTVLIDQADDLNMLICGSFSATNVLNFMQQVKNANGDPEVVMSHFSDHFRSYEGDSVLGLDDMLPDLNVLDLSYCSFLTADALKLFLLKYKQRASVKQTNTTIRHVNILGCDSLVSPSFLNWLDCWKRVGLLEGIELSRQRQS